MELNGLYDPDHHSYLHADVKQYLQTLPAGYFDMVIMDPPTFSNSKRMEDFLDIQRDHPVLINQVLTAMKPGGSLYFSTNFSRFQMHTDALVNCTRKISAGQPRPLILQVNSTGFVFL